MQAIRQRYCTCIGMSSGRQREQQVVHGNYFFFLARSSLLYFYVININGWMSSSCALRPFCPKWVLLRFTYVDDGHYHNFSCSFNVSCYDVRCCCYFAELLINTQIEAFKVKQQWLAMLEVMLAVCDHEWWSWWWWWRFMIQLTCVNLITLSGVRDRNYKSINYFFAPFSSFVRLVFPRSIFVECWLV